MAKKKVVHGVSRLTEHDIYLFREGRHAKLYEKLGAHLMEMEGENGVHFAVWAPNADKVCVTGDFNGWNRTSHELAVRWDGSGIWEGFIPNIGKGERYKYRIFSQHNNYEVDKCDPFAFHCEMPPKTASVVWDLDYTWNDEQWMKERWESNNHESPISIYEMHLGSWRRKPEDNNRSLSYTETADYLVEHMKSTGFTHVEFMPVMEHPFYGSWGYQVTGFFAPTSRYGTPQELMYLIDKLHQNGIAVYMDWVPSHFPTDEHGLGYFDGTHLYEHADPRQGIHPDWKSAVFNYDRNEVRSFLTSYGMFWVEVYHADGLRTDAVASMLYLDYSRKEGEWVPNQFGGRENIEAIDFLRSMNELIYREYDSVQTIAEESTAWPMVSKPVYVGGLGFGFKWNMGWMHDTLEFMRHDPIHRRFHHNQLTFSILYAFSENFMLPLSHDEVVHGKGSLLSKMPGDPWREFANLRLLYGYMWGHPGKKLLFMGGEYGQGKEWNHDIGLDMHLMEYEQHHGIKRWVEDLNRVYREEPSMHQLDCSEQGFEWVDCNDAENSVIAFLRKSSDGDMILVALNFTPVPRVNYRFGVPKGGYWSELLNSDAPLYGGSGWGNVGGLKASPVPAHGHFSSLSMTLPPLSAVFMKPAHE